MINMNIYGNIGKNIRTNTITRQDGTQSAVVNFSVASNRNTGQKDEKGKPVQEVTWIEVALWGNPNYISTMVNLLQNRAKAVIVVTDRLAVETYTTNSGEIGKSIKVVAQNVQIVDWKDDQADDSAASQPKGESADTNTAPADPEDIPF